MDAVKRPLQVVRELYGSHQAPTCEEAHRAVVARFSELLSDPAVLQQVCCVCFCVLLFAH